MTSKGFNPKDMIAERERWHDEFWRLHAQANNFFIGYKMFKRLKDDAYYSADALKRMCRIMRVAIEKFNDDDRQKEFTFSTTVTGICIGGTDYYLFKKGDLVKVDSDKDERSSEV